MFVKILVAEELLSALELQDEGGCLVMLPAKTLGDLLQQSCCFLRAFMNRGTWISSCVASENWPWPESAGVALDPSSPALSHHCHPLILLPANPQLRWAAWSRTQGIPGQGGEAGAGTVGTFDGT